MQDKQIVGHLCRDLYVVLLQLLVHAVEHVVGITVVACRRETERGGITVVDCGWDTERGALQ